MSKINEVFGFSLGDKSDKAENNRRQALCPFMNAPCDGGGNRYLSQANLDHRRDADLIKYFLGKKRVQAGVCSLDCGKIGKWIVCPRRLFTCANFGRPLKVSDFRPHEQRILQLAGLETGVHGVWKEVKIKFEQTENEVTKRFDYTFDYIISPLIDVELDELRSIVPAEVMSNGSLERSGYFIKGERILLVPFGRPLILEIMTSSTSGGNRAKGTDITQAFKAAIRGEDHAGPGINYRQVWARMVSQLIVKSQVGLAWGGKTIWILQDELAKYIHSSTALNLKNLASAQLSDVNIAACGYNGDSNLLEFKELYAGTIESVNDRIEKKPYFLEIIKAPVIPPHSYLKSLLLKSPPDFILEA